MNMARLLDMTVGVLSGCFECRSFTLTVTPVHRKLRMLLLWKWSWGPFSML